MDGVSPRRREYLMVRLSVLVIVFVAYVLQTSTLTLQSMWFDEVMALEYTKGSLAETVRTIVQPHHNGPLFYLLLFWWRHLAGSSDFAVRFLSVLCAVLSVPLLFQWVNKGLSRRAGVVAAWLFAFSPFVLWFAQEAKMYALHMLTAVASSLALLEAFRRRGWWRWFVYASLASATLYSHFFGACLVAAQGIAALLLGWRRPKRLLAYVIAMSLLALLHLPLLRYVWQTLKDYQPRDIWRGFVPLHRMFPDAVGYYFYNLPLDWMPWPMLLLPVVLVCGSGLLLMFRLLRSREQDAGIVLVHAFVPVLIYYLLSFRIPVYWAKYLSAVLPAFFALVAWGMERLARFWRPAGLVMVLLGMLMTLSTVRVLTDPVVQRDNWRFAADYIDAHEGTNDLVLLFAHYTRFAFQRYYRGVSDVEGFGGDPYDPWPAYQKEAARYDRLWLVLSHDQAMAPGHKLHEVAATAFPVITEQFPSAGRIRIIGYQLRYEYPGLPGWATPLEVRFGNGLRLVGYWVDARTLPATERLSHPPSNWLHVVLYWQRTAQVDLSPFRPLVRLVDSSLNVWGGNMERRPDVFDRYPPTAWPLDAVIETHFDLNLNPATPPGVYRLEVSLALEGDEHRRVAVVNALPDTPADRFIFETINIIR
ncbi:MAG: glycosyltransferase family 39 protein [Anaerolineae bacterium]|nr:glycosyltransferase family 39 protein [Anaerolineae bacterium]